jgi:hypothetical protein
MNFYKLGFVISLTLCACSSSSAPPTKDNGTGGNDNDVGTQTGPLAKCAPPAGQYTAHYTRTAGDESKCPDIGDVVTSVSPLTIEIIQPPHCTATPDPETCTLTTHCEQETHGLSRTDHTVMHLSKTSVGGTMRFANKGPDTDTDCTYEFKYTKK